MRLALVSIILLAFIGSANVTTGQDKKDVATFEVYKDKSDEFRFRFKEGDAILAISGKGYKTKADVDKVIAQIKKDAAKAKVVDDTKDK